MQPKGNPLPWTTVEKTVDGLIDLIKERTQAKEMRLFLSESGNYRLKVASVKKYKGQRMPEKPYWFHDIRHYLYEQYGAESVYGCEADDKMSILQRQLSSEGTVTCIASRDKDLRIVPGWHYSWPCGDYQPEKPLYLVDELGELWPKWKQGKRGPLIDKLGGCGLKFFYAQLIMGDTADNIPGAPRKGATYAYNAINECTSEAEMYMAVVEAYEDAYKGWYTSYKDWRGFQQRKHVKDIVREMGILLWMQKHDGEMWTPPKLSDTSIG